MYSCCAQSIQLRAVLLTREHSTKVPAFVLSKSKSRTRPGKEDKGYALLVVPVITFGLGIWQVYRRNWKLNLIRELEEKTSSTPVELPENLVEINDMEYRRLRVRGHFDHSKEQIIAPRTLLEKGGKDTPSSGLMSSGNSGAHVVTPFVLADRDLTILVNRGWVSKRNIRPQNRSNGQISDQIEIVGVVRKTENRQPFQPKITEAEKEETWIRRDVEGMAVRANVAPIFIDADYDSSVPGGPVGGQTRVSIRNEHLSYIVTWFSLSVATGYLWYSKFIKNVHA